MRDAPLLCVQCREFMAEYGKRCASCDREAKRHNRKWLWISSGIFLACLVLDSRTKHAGAPLAQAAEDISATATHKPKDYEAKWAAEQAIKRILVAPSTAKFHGTSMGQSGKYFAFVFETDAQNSFGAVLRKNYCVIVHEVDENGNYNWGPNAIRECNTEADIAPDSVHKWMAQNDWPN